jgi:hypothetical protein
MISRSAATVLFGASTAIAGLYVLIRVVKNEKKVTRKRTGSTDHNANGETGIISASKMLSSSSTMNGNGGDDYKNRSKARITKTSKTAAPCEDLDDAPMFNYSDPKLCEAVIAMAQNRAKRWISYQVTGASRLVGQVGGKVSPNSDCGGENQYCREIVLCLCFGVNCCRHLLQNQNSQFYHFNATIQLHSLVQHFRPSLHTNGQC